VADSKIYIATYEAGLVILGVEAPAGFEGLHLDSASKPSANLVPGAENSSGREPDRTTGLGAVALPLKG
jgi:hypothetical protein